MNSEQEALLGGWTLQHLPRVGGPRAGDCSHSPSWQAWGRLRQGVQTIKAPGGQRPPTQGKGHEAGAELWKGVAAAALQH